MPLIIKKKIEQEDNNGALAQAPIVVPANENELEDIEAQIKKLNEIKQQKLEELEKKRKEEEAKKPSKLTVEALAGVFVSIIRSEDTRVDITNLIQSIPSARFSGYGYKRALIPLNEWKSLRAQLDTLTPPVDVRIANKELKAEIEYLLDTPPWTLSLAEKYLIAKWGPNTDSFILHSIPGAEYDYGKKLVKIPKAEAHTTYNRLEGISGVTWDEDAQEFVIAQIDRRRKLDEVALKEESEIYKGMDRNGVILRPFQGVGAEFLDAAEGRGLIADEMGLGKTYQYLFHTYHNRETIKKVLIICQAALKPKWVREVKRIYGDDVKYYVPSSSVPTDLDFVALFKNTPEIVIINFDLIGEHTKGIKEGVNESGFNTKEHKSAYLWIKLLNVWKPDSVCVDECHYAKNRDAHRTKAILDLKSERFVGLSGTPVLNRPAELWTILHKIAPDTFPAYETFIAQYTTQNGKYPKNTEELRHLLKPIMIRRLTKEVQKDLPPINRITEWHTLSQRAATLYEMVMQGLYEKIAEYDAKGIGGDKKAVTDILTRIMRLKQICAISKVEQTAELATSLYDQTDETSHRKVLIFTQFKATCYRIAQLLSKDTEALSFVDRRNGEFITANAEERDKLVQQFQTDPEIKYLVVTEKTAKEGHNITAAGHVIFNDLFWTPAAHQQSEGRAYGRLNDSHHINSYYVVTDMGGSSIEEWIQEMLLRKLDVINQTVEGLNDERDVSIQNELISRIKEAMYVNRRKK